MKTNTIKAIIFCRVSSREQEESGYSLDAQQKLLTDEAIKNNFAVEKIYRISESASGKAVRKAFIEILQFCRKNKINVILCEKIDRLTRNLKDAALVDDWVKEAPDRSVHFVKEHFILNRQTKAHDNFVWDMKVAVARFYTNNLSEEVKKGQKEKLAQGWSPQGEPPLGYKIAGEKGHKIHIIDEERAPLVKKLFELYSTRNYSLSALTKIIKNEGLRTKKGKPLSRTRIHTLLSSPFYYGDILWMGKIYKGNQEPLINKGLFDAVQKQLSYKFGGKPKYNKHLYVFSSKIKCVECGGTVAWELQKGQLYGHCNHYKNCSQKISIKQNKVEEQIFPYFDGVEPKDKKILDWLENALKEGHSNEINYNTNKREGLNKIVRFADQRIEGAYRDKLDGIMPVELCEKIIKESTKEKEDALNSLNDLSKDRAAYYRAGYSIHELSMHAKEIYESKKATLETKRLLLSQIFSNLGLNEGKISTNYTFGFEFLVKWVPELNNTFELAKTGSFKNKTGSAEPVCTIMRGRGDLNP